MATRRVSAIEKLFIDRLDQHEESSRESIRSVESKIDDLSSEQRKQHDAVMGVLAIHAAKIEVHDHRLGTVESGVAAVVAQSGSESTAKLRALEDSRALWLKWFLGVVSALLVASIIALVTVAVRNL